MKYLALAFILFAAVSAQDDACELCLEKVSIALMHMNGDAIPQIINLLNEKVCPNMPWDVEECKTGVATYWPAISEKIFSRAAGPYICGPDFIGSCSERPPPQKTKDDVWDCEACANGVSAFGSFYENDEVVAIITAELQGADFCTNPDNGFPDEAVEECALNIATFMPSALKEIGDAVIFFNFDLCDEWYEGICNGIHSK